MRIRATAALSNPTVPARFGVRATFAVPGMLCVLCMLAVVVLAACASSASAPWQTQDTLNAVDGSTWVVGDRLVTLSPSASQPAKPRVGSMVRVSGQRTSRGELVADTVEVLDQPAAQSAAPAPAPSSPRTVSNPPKAPAPARPKKSTRDGGD